MGDEVYQQITWPPMPLPIDIEISGGRREKVVRFDDLIEYLRRLEETITDLRLGAQYFSGEITPPGGPIPNKLYVQLHPYLGTGAWNDANGSILLEDGEYTRYFLYIPDYIDDSKDIKLIFLFSSDQTDATFTLSLYVEATKTDNSAARSWNVEDGTSVTFNSAVANRRARYEYTLASGDFEKGNFIGIAIANGQGAATELYAYSAMAELTALAS